MTMRAVFYREQAARMYAPEAYAASIALVELPWLTLYAALFTVITYFMVGLAPLAGTFFAFALGVLTLAIFYIALGDFFAGLAPNLTINALMTALAFGLLQLFCGLYVPVGAMPSGWRWFYYLCGTAQSLRFLGLPQLLGNLTIHTTLGVDVPLSALAEYQFSAQASSEDAWRSYGYLWLIAAVFYALSFLSYRCLNWTKR